MRHDFTAEADEEVLGFALLELEDVGFVELLEVDEAEAIDEEELEVPVGLTLLLLALELWLALELLEAPVGLIVGLLEVTLPVG